jgi:hypothetical protein
MYVQYALYRAYSSVVYYCRTRCTWNDISLCTVYVYRYYGTSLSVVSWRGKGVPGHAAKEGIAWYLIIGGVACGT